MNYETREMRLVESVAHNKSVEDDHRSIETEDLNYLDPLRVHLEIGMIVKGMCAGEGE